MGGAEEESGGWKLGKGGGMGGACHPFVFLGAATCFPSLHHIEDSKTTPLQLTFLILLNFLCGPDRDEDMRFTEVTSTMKWFFKTVTPSTPSLFDAGAPAMIEELGDLLTISDAASPNEILWKFLKVGHTTV